MDTDTSGAILISGCQRSGTTLMRLILGSRPDVECHDEPHSYTLLARDQVPEAGRRLALKVPRVAEQLDKPRAVDLGMPAIERCLMSHDVLFMVRNPLDAVASMLTLCRGEWYTRWCWAGLAWRAQRDDQFHERLMMDLDGFRHDDPPREVGAALYWIYKNEALQRYQQLRMPVHQVSYERLVSPTTKRATLAKVGAFLRLPWCEAVMSHHQAQHTQSSRRGITVGETNARVPTTAERIGRWRDVLDAQATDRVRKLAWPLWEELREPNDAEGG
jgi:hypothetical protein